MKYIKGKKTIEASEKAFNLIYKEQGFKPYKEEINQDTPDNEEGDEYGAEGTN